MITIKLTKEQATELYNLLECGVLGDKDMFTYTGTSNIMEEIMRIMKTDPNYVEDQDGPRFM